MIHTQTFKNIRSKKGEVVGNRPPIKKKKINKHQANTKVAVIEAVERYLKLGYNLTTSCELAFIPRSTFVSWCKEDPRLRQKVQEWRNHLSIKARENVSKAIEMGVIGMDESKWWLERKNKKEFSTRTEVADVDDETDLQEERDFSDIDAVIKKNTK